MNHIKKEEPWEMTKEEFDRTQAVASFDEVKSGQPIILRAFHGSHQDKNKLKSGFLVPEQERNPLVESLQARFVLREDRDKQGFLGRGVYFTDSKSIASNYGTPYQVEIRLNKPYILWSATIDVLRNLDLSQIIDEGYDAILVLKGRHGLHGESYRQGIVFDPSKIRIVEGSFHPGILTKRAKVINRETGEIGEVKEIIQLNQNVKEYWLSKGHDFNSFLVIRWKGPPAKTEYNVKDIDIYVSGGHEDIVYKAYSKGKPVPPEVLADYPDLAKMHTYHSHVMPEKKHVQED